MSESLLRDPAAAPAAPAGAKEPAQRTLTAIGDVSVAVDATVGRVRLVGRLRLWLALVVFAVVVYGVAVAADIFLLARDWTTVIWLLPLVPTFAAVAAYGSRLAWKRRARIEQARAKLFREALDEVSFDSANASTSAHANLLGLKTAASHEARAQHEKQIAGSIVRIDEALLRIQKRVRGR